MANLLDESGLKVGAFEPVLAAILGNNKNEPGANVLAEAVVFSRPQVQLRDWFYCLAKAPSTRIRKYLVDRMGRAPDKFVELLEKALRRQNESQAMPPDQLTSQTVAPAVLNMLETAERLAKENSRRVDDVVLTIALFEAADPDLKRMLSVWATEKKLDDFLNGVRGELPPIDDIDVFTAEGHLNQRVFAPSGRKFCVHMSEDGASTGATKLTTRHMLYSLLGNESGLLHVALAMRGIDVKREVHSVLSRELVRPGKKRNNNFEMNRETTFEPVAQVLKDAHRLARKRGAPGITEFDVNRAFIVKQGRELTRLFTAEKPLDLPAVIEYMESADPEEEHDERPFLRLTINEIEEQINMLISGQEKAIERVIPWVKRLRFGLPRDGRPAAVLLFLGPTGAGKTQLAKELARFVYGDEEQMIFIEMGQFKSKESMTGFIGASPGYIGYGEGKLTNGLRDKPECVVLFDEIEKANTEVFDVLLRFADEGMISDPAGPVRDGRKCIIVMTTNAGQRWMREQFEANPEARNGDRGVLAKQLFDAAREELQAAGFRPEFLGRVDERISFLPFTQDTCRKIVDGVLKRELEKFLKLKGVTIEVTEQARNILAKFAYDRSIDEGARGAPRAVNDFVVTPAIDLLSNFETNDPLAPTHLITVVEGLDQIALEVNE